jgi:hypothetical protein
VYISCVILSDVQQPHRVTVVVSSEALSESRYQAAVHTLGAKPGTSTNVTPSACTSTVLTPDPSTTGAIGAPTASFTPLRYCMQSPPHTTSIAYINQMDQVGRAGAESCIDSNP